MGGLGGRWWGKKRESVAELAEGRRLLVFLFRVHEKSLMPSTDGRRRAVALKGRPCTCHFRSVERLISIIASAKLHVTMADTYAANYLRHSSDPRAEGYKVWRLKESSGINVFNAERKLCLDVPLLRVVFERLCLGTANSKPLLPQRNHLGATETTTKSCGGSLRVACRLQNPLEFMFSGVSKTSKAGRNFLRRWYLFV